MEAVSRTAKWVGAAVARSDKRGGSCVRTDKRDRSCG